MKKVKPELRLISKIWLIGGVIFVTLMIVLFAGCIQKPEEVKPVSIPTITSVQPTQTTIQTQTLFNKLLGSISKTNQSINDLIKSLDELYQILDKGNELEVEVKVNDYLAKSKSANQDVSNTYSDFKDLSVICTSSKNYQEIDSKFYDSTVDLHTNVIILDSYLYTYLEGTGDKTVIKNKINETKSTALSNVDSLQEIAETVKECYKPK